ncbi:MAG TPA: quinoprotein dehydrogenase-associated putative ABC transporter substrate-binding protein [Longimicrobiaceae bacterium]|nr:quinoprotein dehydrogenase-associated putative ABC transporter substrate-binding protein [Longimicrobiaceae bacterium]
MPHRTLPAVLLCVAALLAGCAGSASEKAPEKAPRELRVCADPNNLPFSNERGEGLENRLAALVAREMGAEVKYTWWAQRRGFIRNTLRAGACDVVMGVPTSFELVLPTAPYYRSTYVFVYRKDAPFRIDSFDDPDLRTLRVGVHLVGDDGANTPPAHALAARGIIENVAGYTLYGDYSEPNPPARILEALGRGEIDVAVVWGPLAGYFAPRQDVPLEIVPVSPQIDLPFLPFVFDVSMGVERGDTALMRELERILDENRGEVETLLDEYGVVRVGEARVADGAVRVGFIAPEGGAARHALRGAELAAEEAGRAAELVDRPFMLLTARASGPDEAARAARRLAGQGAFAIVGGYDEASCRALAAVAESERLLFLNVGCRGDALRAAAPVARHTFHVEASERMYRQAGARTAGGPVLWHGGLTRYGAAQLNDRFRRRFGSPPAAPEWAAWFAVKTLWETAAREGTTDPARLAAVLESDSARFDGHKGAPLGFGRADHQLRQPLYEAPAPAPGGGEREGPAARPAVAARLPTLDRVRLGAGPHLLVSNEGSGDVTVIDARTRRAVARIPVGLRPRGIQTSADGARVYVALSDDAPTAESDADAVAAVDLRTGRLAARHSAGSDPEQFALSPDGRTLYASNEDAGTASVTDLRDGSVAARLAVGIEPEGVAVSPDGRWVYVTAETSNTVSVIDTRKNEVVASFLVDVRPRAAAFAPDGRRAYVTNEISGTVSVVDVARHAVVRTVRLDRSAKPVGVVVSPDGRRVYVANGHGHSVAVIDAAAARVVATVPVGRRPWGIAVSPDGRWVYTANGGSDDVSVVDAAALREVARVPAGSRPWGVAFRRSGAPR